MANVKVTYVGGVDEVFVRFPSGNTATVKRGQSVDVFPADAATLSPTEWEGKGVGAVFDVANLPWDCGGPSPSDIPTPAPEETD